MDQDKAIDCNSINPIDYFNKNCIQECYDLLLKVKNVHSTGIDSLTYVKNKEDENKRMIVIENNCFVAKMSNGFGIPTGESFTPFQMLQKFRFKDEFPLALSYVIYDVMKNQNNNPYKRQDKNSKNRTELKTIFNYLLENEATNTMISKATGVSQKNICRYKRDLEQLGLLIEVKKDLCKITNHQAWYLSTNKQKFKDNSQLDLFS